MRIFLHFFSMICVEMQNIDEIMKTTHQSMTVCLPRPEISLVHQLIDKQKQMLIKMGVLPSEPATATVESAQPLEDK